MYIWSKNGLITDVCRLIYVEELMCIKFSKFKIVFLH